MKEMVWQVKWTTTNHMKVWSPSQEGDVLYMVWLEGSPLLLTPFRKPINSNKYCSQLDQLKAAFDEKWPELVHRKHLVFHQDNTRLHFLWWPGTNCYSLEGESYSSIISPGISPNICHITRHYFGPYKILLVEKWFNSLEDCKRHLEQFFSQKDKKFWKNRIMKLPQKWQKVVDQNGEYIVQ